MGDWQWQLELSADDERKARWLAIATGGASVAGVVVAVLTEARYWIIIAAMLASIFVLGRSATRRLRSVRAVIDGPILTVHDTRGSATIDLSAVDTVDVRRRNSQTGTRWVVEASGPDGAQVHELPGLELYLNLSEEAIESLRSGITHYHQWYHGRRPAASAAAAADIATRVMAPVRTNTSGPRLQDDFTWTAPLVPNAARNRRRVLITTVVVAAAIAAVAVQQNWGDIAAILLSVAVVPGIVLLIGVGCWYAYTPATKFRLVVSDGQIQTWRGSKQTRQVSLDGVTEIVVDVSHTRNLSTNTASSYPYVRITKGSAIEMLALPGSLGANVDAEARVALERRLRQHAGLL